MMWRRGVRGIGGDVQDAGANTRPDVSIVVVSRNTRALLAACVRSVIATAPPLSIETIVVDSDSQDGSAAMVRASFPNVILLAPRENTGYARGNNLGIRRARGETILLLNPDTELTPGALANLHAALNADPAVGIVGPRLRYPDGSTQSSRRRFPTLATALAESTVLQEWWPRNPIVARYYMDDIPDTHPHDADWLVGACLLVRRAVFDAVGLLDERLFLFGEEPEFCWRARRSGWRVRYTPAAVVLHHEGRSTGQDVPARQRAFALSKAHVMGELRGPAARFITVAALVADQSIRLAREAAKWAVGHKRAMRAARVIAAMATLRALLHPDRGRG